MSTPAGSDCHDYNSLQSDEIQADATAERARRRKLNYETIEEQQAELEEFRYKLDMLEARLRNSAFMDPDERRFISEQAKEAKKHLKSLERKLSYLQRRSQKSLIIIFTIFTLFITLYIFLMVKTIWNNKNNPTTNDYD